ncbi:MAG: DUF2779 domain-containing protein [Betaproteobacteria bacterium]
MPRNLSKSRLIEFRQCPKRMWLQIHRPEQRQADPDAQARMDIGNEVGALARTLLAPAGDGILFDAQQEGYAAVFERSMVSLQARRPLFEAGFQHGSLFALVDALLPTDSPEGWRLVEVKSSASVKDYQRDDLAIQAFILRQAGVQLEAASVATIDSTWVYPGGGHYQGLLKQTDLLEEAQAREAEVQDWRNAALQVCEQPEPPSVAMGAQCKAPFACPYTQHCQAAAGPADATVTSPIEWLPGHQSSGLREFVTTHKPRSMAELPDALLSPVQRRVKHATLSNTPWVDRAALQPLLTGFAWPVHFLDFEAVQFAIPRWAGTRPFEQIAFQYSLHTLDSDGPQGRLTHTDFLDLSGQDPRRPLAEQLARDLGNSQGSVLAYNKGFEGMVLRALAAQFDDLAPALNAIEARLVDLLPITRATYYHPLQQGSWSIKRVLPTIPGQTGYAALGAVADGQAAVQAYLEAVRLIETAPDQVNHLAQALRAYCEKDTAAMVALWKHLRDVSASA